MGDHTLTVTDLTDVNIANYANLATGTISGSCLSTNAASSGYISVNWPETNINDNEDLFKQITSLLGLKIINVLIKYGTVTLVCKRNKRMFTIDISNSQIVIKSKDTEIARIFLSNNAEHTHTMTPTTNPWKGAFPDYTTWTTLTGSTDLPNATTTWSEYVTAQ